MYTITYKSNKEIIFLEDLEKAKATARSLANWNILTEVRDENGVVLFAPKPYNEDLAT